MIFDELLNEKISPTKNFNGQNLETVKKAFEYYGLNSSHVELIKKMILGNETTKNYLFQVCMYVTCLFFLTGIKFYI